MSFFGSDLKPQILKRFGDPGQVIIKDADIAAFINDALVQLCRATDSFYSFTTAKKANNFPINLNSDTINISRVTYGGATPTTSGWFNTGRALTATTSDDLQQKGFSLEATGVPEFWYPDPGLSTGAAIWTYPRALPGDTSPVCVVYTGTPPVVGPSLTDNLLEVPDAWIPDVVTFAVSRCHEVNKDWSAANQLMAQFNNNIAQARHESLSGDDMSYPVVRDDPGYADYGGSYY